MLLAAIAACLAAALTPTTALATADSTTALTGLATVAYQSLQGYIGSSANPGLHYYASGVWHSGDGPACWYCYDAAAVGAATLSQTQQDAGLRQIAIDTFNTAIAQHQLASGAFANDGGDADGIATGFFTVDLGVAYLELRSTRDAPTRARWANAIEAAADYLINSGDETWYINGNVNLRQTEVMWLAWAVTGQQRYLTQYDAEWSFTVSPPQGRWPGYGLQVTQQPTRSDGSDGSGYLAESSGLAPGYDTAYTDAQLDTATDLYVLTHDPKYLRLMNLELNQLRPRIDSTLTLDATGGSRSNYKMPFGNPAPSVLLASGDRPDLASLPSAQLARIASEYSGSMAYTNVNFYKDFESWLSMPLLNNQWPNGMAPDTRVASGPDPTPGPPTTVTVTPPGTTGGSVPGTVTVTVSNPPVGSNVSVSVMSVQTPVAPTKGSTSARRPTVARATRKKVKKPKVAIRLRPPKRRAKCPRGRTCKVAVRVVVSSHHGTRRITVTLRPTPSSPRHLTAAKHSH
jgi:hypothetical protein